MPLKTQSKKKEEDGTWIVDATITWPKMRLFSKALTSLSKSKFDWEMVVWLNQIENSLSWWRQIKVRDSSTMSYYSQPKRKSSKHWLNDGERLHTSL